MQYNIIPPWLAFDLIKQKCMQMHIVYSLHLSDMMIGNDIEPSLSLCIIKVKRTIFKRKLPDWDWDYELVKR